MVETNNLVKKKLLLFVFGILFLISLVSSPSILIGTSEMTRGKIVYTTPTPLFLPADISAHTNNTIAVGSAGVWYNVTFDQEASVFKKRITHNYNDATNYTFIIQDSGTYEINYHLIFEDSQATPLNHIVTRITRNNVELNGFTIEVDTTKQNADVGIHHSDLADLTAGDEIILSFTSDSTTVSLNTHLTYGTHQNTGHLTINRIS